jgi:release factor glutamine methyltransferase
MPPGGPAAATVAWAAARLAAAGLPSPRVDAELLAAHVLGTPRSRLLLAAPFDPGQAERFGYLVDRRARREPLQHLTGSAPFRTIDLLVGPGVFVPRPETELLVDEALRRLPARPADAPGPVVVDLCSGSGAIALAVAHELPGARVTAVEADPDAYRWLERNAARRAAAGDPPVRTLLADVTDPGLPAGVPGLAALAGRVDAVLCNPPYVPDGTPVPPEVAGHDPARAVFGGPDGLAVIRPVAALAVRLLRPGGLLAVEHDDSHAPAVLAALREQPGLTGVAGHDDLTGRPRYVTASALRWQTGQP